MISYNQQLEELDVSIRVANLGIDRVKKRLDALNKRKEMIKNRMR